MKDIHCCNLLRRYISDDSVAITYHPCVREYSIEIKTSSIAVILIDYCPWCGQKLQESLRDIFCEEIRELGLEPFDDNLPKKYMSDEWWQEREL